MLAPEAVNDELFPGQIIDDAAETKTVGIVLTVNRRVTGTVQPVTDTV